MNRPAKAFPPRASHSSLLSLALDLSLCLFGKRLVYIFTDRKTNKIKFICFSTAQTSSCCARTLFTFSDFEHYYYILLCFLGWQWFLSSTTIPLTQLGSTYTLCVVRLNSQRTLRIVRTMFALYPSCCPIGSLTGRFWLTESSFPWLTLILINTTLISIGCHWQKQHGFLLVVLIITDITLCPIGCPQSNWYNTLSHWAHYTVIRIMSCRLVLNLALAPSWV